MASWFIFFFCRKQWWLGTNMVTTHILMHTKLPCKRAFIRDIIPMICGIQVSSLRRSNDPPGKRQAPDACVNWSAWQVRCWTSLFLSLTAIAITFNCSRQVGTAILAMLSEDVLMSTLQSMSTSRGRETGGLRKGCVRLSNTQWHQTLGAVTTTMHRPLHFWPWEVSKFSCYYVVSHHLTLE